MRKLILHVPHSSTCIPLMDGYVVDRKLLENEILKLTDWYTEDLFHIDDELMIVAPFSRIFCDVERFADDDQEVMAQFGMGALYEKNDDGEAMRVITEELRKKVLNDYYWRHHAQLSMAVDAQLKDYGMALILDCHSYPSKPLKRALDQRPDRPDFNIGTDAYHTPQRLIDASIDFFDNNGYSLGGDRPYTGCIVPMEHYQTTKQVASIMLEVNRNLYMNEETGERSEQYLEIKKICIEYAKVLKSCF